MGRATALLRERAGLSGPELARAAAATGFLALLGLYYAVSERLPNVPQEVDAGLVYFLATALMFAPVYLAVGLRSRRHLLATAVALALLAAVLHVSGAQLAASIPKLAAATLVGFLFLRLCEKAWILVLIALLASTADTLSVWRGPTNQILTNAPQVFDALAVAAPFPGERLVELRWDASRTDGVDGYLVYRRRAGGPERSLTDEPFCTSGDDCGREIFFYDGAEPAKDRAVYHVVVIGSEGESGRATIAVPARGDGEPRAGARSGSLAPRELRAKTSPAAAGLGVSDVIFFGLFLAGAARFGLRPRLTWLALVISIGVTGVVAVYGDFFGLNGLPALPGLSLAFLLVNADLLWRRLRGEEVDLDAD